VAINTHRPHMNSPKQSVLVADDSATDRLYLQKILDDPSWDLVIVESGAAAVDAARVKEFALAILDVEMPGMDGYGAAERIRGLTDGHNTPIIFITGTPAEDARIFRGYDTGAVDFLFKPVQPALLKSKVRVFCELSAQRIIIEEQLREIRAKNEVLQQRLDEIKVLRGLVPICVSCKKVRDDRGYWSAIETYLASFSDAEFSHGLCPNCVERLYPELNDARESSPTDSS